jgi:hypothetical protein
MRTCLIALFILSLTDLGLGQSSNHEHSGARYFPSGVFASGPKDKFPDSKADWFGEQLASLDEPSLKDPLLTESSVYRFTVLPSFTHPVSVRLTIHKDGTGTVVVRVGEGAGGYAPKKTLSDHARSVSEQDVTQFLKKLNKEHFWKQSTEPPLSSLVGCDGTQWLMEGNSDHYHAVERWEGGSLRRLGMYMLNELGKVGPEAGLPKSID